MSEDSSREMSDSKDIQLKFLPAVVGLVNSNGVGCSSRSATGLLTEPGQLKL